jgi:hypothetical protein
MTKAKNAKDPKDPRSATRIAIVSLCIAVVSLLFSILTYFDTAKYHHAEYDPLLTISSERPDYSHPKLQEPGSPEWQYLLKNKVAPRWFSYEAALENPENRPVTIAALYMCFRKPGDKGCPNAITLGKSIVIGNGKQFDIKYKSDNSSTLPIFFDAQNLEILLHAEVSYPGNEVKVWERKVGGFSDGKPLLVRNGTTMPEGSAMAVEMHFDAPRE